MDPQPVALVTGAASGIGRATALAFAQNGYSVVLADSNAVAGEEVAEAIASSGGTSLFVECDVASEPAVCHLLDQAIGKFGRVDAAFNNAGIEGATAECADSTAENFDRVVSVNLRGVWLCMREEIRRMLKQETGGSIVNCSSVAGLIGLPGISAYAASKHGVLGLTRTAALEYAKRNIRVNAVCPGAIETPMLERFMSTAPGGREMMTATEPVGRIGRPEEIADAVLWLCGRASFVTGHALAVDGGWTAA